jgi:8-oxo-dGTP pyrophosphatase MutT (NUDIX family)
VGSARRSAAVLAPAYDGPDGPTLVFIRRTTRVNHPGQVAFPGGRPEPGDRDLLQTALREAHEEVGLNPDEVSVLGALPVVETVTSNYAISAFVGRLLDRSILRPQPDEVAAILDVPLEALLAPGMPLDEEWDVPVSMDPPTLAESLGSAAVLPTVAVHRRRVRYYPWGDDRIWGATQRIVEYLLAAVRRGDLTL